MTGSHRFGKRCPMGETGLELVGANLLVSRMTLGAAAATGDERNRHAVTDPEAPHVASGRHHLAGRFMARHMRQADIRIMAHPAMPVAAAKTARADPDDDAVAGRPERKSVV